MRNLVSRAFEPVHDTGSKQSLSKLIDEFGDDMRVEGHERSMRVSEEVRKGDRGSIGA